MNIKIVIRDYYCTFGLLLNVPVKQF